MLELNVYLIHVVLYGVGVDFCSGYQKPGTAPMTDRMAASFYLPDDKWSVWHSFPIINVLALSLVSPSVDIRLYLSYAAITRSIRPDERS